MKARAEGIDKTLQDAKESSRRRPPGKHVAAKPHSELLIAVMTLDVNCANVRSDYGE